MDGIDVAAKVIATVTSPIWIGPVIVYAIVETIKEILDKKRLQKWMRDNGINNAVKILAKSAKKVSFQDVENKKKYQLKADKVADDIHNNDVIHA